MCTRHVVRALQFAKINLLRCSLLRCWILDFKICSLNSWRSSEQLETDVESAYVAEWFSALEIEIWRSLVQILHPIAIRICSGSVVSRSNPRPRRVNSQLVSLLPVVIPKSICSICNVCLFIYLQCPQFAQQCCIHLTLDRFFLFDNLSCNYSDIFALCISFQRG